MANLFLTGLSKEYQQIKAVNRLHAACEQLISEIEESEQEFVVRSYAANLRKIARNLLNQCELGDGDKSSVSMRLFDYALALEINPVSHFHQIPPDIIQHFQNARLEKIRFAFQNNIVIPERILSQFPTDQIHKDFGHQSKGDKICQTTRACESGFEDYSLVSQYGVILRRQDGNQVTHQEIDQIKAGLDEIFMIFDGLPALMRAIKLTIIHSSGRNLSRSRFFGGIYNIIRGTISVGVTDDETGKPAIQSLAHELIGHWLDFAGTPSQTDMQKILNPEVYVPTNYYTISFLDCLNQWTSSSLCKALATMNAIDHWHNRLTSLVRPSEVYARMTEQFVAVKLLQNGIQNPSTVYRPGVYFTGQGYWSESHWDNWLGREVALQIEARIQMALKVHDIVKNEPAEDTLQRKVLPWISKITDLRQS